MTRLIGVHGFARTGKDSLAQYLEPYGFQRLAFADPIREALLRMNPWLHNPQTDNSTRLQTLLGALGWDMLKTDRVYGAEVRRLLQVLGTEVGRELIAPDVWIRTALNKLQPGRSYVITDVRYMNELLAIEKADPTAKFVKMVRPGTGPVNAHTSDAGLPDELFDYIVVNETSQVSDLAYAARVIALGEED